jgi:hypothetical protein
VYTVVIPTQAVVNRSSGGHSEDIESAANRLVGSLSGNVLTMGGSNVDRRFLHDRIEAARLCWKPIWFAWPSPGRV